MRIGGERAHLHYLLQFVLLANTLMKYLLPIILMTSAVFIIFAVPKYTPAVATKVKEASGQAAKSERVASFINTIFVR